jgi:O-antigen/teichoic acid export membrane protein
VLTNSFAFFRLPRTKGWGCRYFIDVRAINVNLSLSGSVWFVGIWILSVFTINGQLDLAVSVVAFSPVLVYLAATFYTFSNIHKSIRPSFGFIKFKSSKELFNLSGQFFVVQITATIIFASLPFIITRFYGPEAVAQYHVANSIFNFPIMVIGLFTAPLVPFVTREFAKGNLAWIRSSLKKVLILSALVCLGTLILVFLSPYIYRIWLGDKIEVPFQLTVLIGFYTIINVLVNPLSSFMNAIGKINILVWMAPIGVGMFLGGCYVFDFLIGDVTAIVFALSLTSVVGLIIEPFVLVKHLKIAVRSSVNFK